MAQTTITYIRKLVTPNIAYTVAIAVYGTLVGSEEDPTRARILTPAIQNLKNLICPEI